MVAGLVFALLSLPQLCSCSATFRALLEEVDANETNATMTTTTTTVAQGSCTPKDTDFWAEPSYGLCCEGLEKCTERRPKDDEFYCDASDPNHESSCWSYADMCRTSCPCTPANEDYYDPAYDFGRCCDGLEKCLEKRPESNSVYCPDSDPGHEITCWSHIEICRSSCGSVSWVRISGEMGISLEEDSLGLLSDASAIKAVGSSLARAFGVGESSLTVAVSQDEARRLAAQNITLSYTIDLSAESADAANSWAENLKGTISTFEVESLTLAINDNLESLGYSLSVLSFSPIEVETIATDSGSGSDSGDGSGATSSDGSSGPTASGGSDDEENGSVMQSQLFIFTMLLLFVTKMDQAQA